MDFRWLHKEEHAKVAIHGVPDRRDPERGRVGDARRRGVAKAGISKATYFLWRSKYGGATVKELARLKDLESENAKLKRMYADLALENAAIKDVLSRKL